MNCARNGCLASFTWFGADDDKALTAMANERGWRVLEGSGWVCPHHVQRARSSRSGDTQR